MTHLNSKVSRDSDKWSRVLHVTIPFKTFLNILCNLWLGLRRYAHKKIKSTINIVQYCCIEHNSKQSFVFYFMINRHEHVKLNVLKLSETKWSCWLYYLTVNSTVQLKLLWKTIAYLTFYAKLPLSNLTDFCNNSEI